MEEEVVPASKIPSLNPLALYVLEHPRLRKEPSDNSRWATSLSRDSQASTHTGLASYG